MDVEAQDDGIMAKIIANDGSKSIKVGSRIAVLAEVGDDITSLDIPPDEATPPTKSSSSEQDKSQDSANSQKSEPPSAPAQPAADRHPPSASDAHKPHDHKYPLYPSVQHLLHQNNIAISDASKIPASGPNGRLLKGDVLSFLGSIQKSYSADLSKRLTKMGHLDLSNIKKADPPPPQPKEQARTEKKAPPAPAEPEPATQVAVPVSLAAVFATQRRLQDSLGLTLPLSTFIARASEIANERLPRANGIPASSDELFDALLGLGAAKKTSRGHYVPQITALPPSGTATTIASQSAGRSQQPDIMDILAGVKPQRKPSMPASRSPGSKGVGGTNNVFSVNAIKGDEKRARTYLERIKTVLEAEPGRCVL